MVNTGCVSLGESDIGFQNTKRKKGIWSKRFYENLIPLTALSKIPAGSPAYDLGYDDWKLYTATVKMAVSYKFNREDGVQYFFRYLSQRNAKETLDHESQASRFRFYPSNPFWVRIQWVQKQSGFGFKIWIFTKKIPPPLGKILNFHAFYPPRGASRWNVHNLGTEKIATRRKNIRNPNTFTVWSLHEYGRVSYNGRISLPNLYVEPYSY